jgi:DNA-binding response OmpR family regulator
MPRILVIDDQSDVSAMIAIVLRINYFEIAEAASGTAGLKEFENSRFDLVIVDIFLQGANGFDVIRMMRERIPDLPVVAMSGMTTLDLVAASPELSNVVCLQKPFAPMTWSVRSKRRSDRSHRRGRHCECRRSGRCLTRGFARCSEYKLRTAQKCPGEPGHLMSRENVGSLTTPSD